jgi:hypothetical protein
VSARNRRAATRIRPATETRRCGPLERCGACSLLSEVTFTYYILPGSDMTTPVRTSAYSSAPARRRWSANSSAFPAQESESNFDDAPLEVHGRQHVARERLARWRQHHRQSQRGVTGMTTSVGPTNGAIQVEGNCTWWACDSSSARSDGRRYLSAMALSRLAVYFER